MYCTRYDTCYDIAECSPYQNNANKIGPVGKAGTQLVNVDGATGSVDMSCVSQLPVYTFDGTCPPGATMMPDGSCPFGRIDDTFVPFGPMDATYNRLFFSKEPN